MTLSPGHATAGRNLSTRAAMLNEILEETLGVTRVVGQVMPQLLRTAGRIIPLGGSRSACVAPWESRRRGKWRLQRERLSKPCGLQSYNIPPSD